MGFLTEYQTSTITLGKIKFLINPAFDAVLEVQQLFSEEDLTERDKVEQALKMFVINSRRLRLIGPKEKVDLLNEIYRQCINTRKYPRSRKKERILDFEYDGEYIYSSFMLDYGIDLIDEQGRLPWKKFIALFHGLSENTKIREVMRIRGMDIPNPTGKNGMQIQKILDLKSYYALPVKGGGGQSGLDALFATLEGMAVNRA